MGSVVTVEEVAGRRELGRFIELPQALHGHDPRFAPLVLSWERVRLDQHRNSYFDTGEVACFLARRLGRPAGRIAAHLPAPGADGRFGFWWCEDDAAVADALLDAARAWLAERGCHEMAGPWSLTEDDEVGVQVDGHEHPGATGRPWHPPHLAGRLEAAGVEPLEDRPTWRLATVAGSEGAAELDPDLPRHAGAYADPRLALPAIAAVPDVAPALRSRRGLRDSLALARQAKERRWDTCTVVRCRADPAAAVSALQRAAGAAGYSQVITPWCPDPTAPPETVHRTYRLRW